MKKIGLLSLFFGGILSLNAQNITLFPTNWFVGMKWNNVQVIVKSDDSSIHNSSVNIKYPGVQLKKVHQFENGKYLALDINISPSVKPGNINIVMSNKGKTIVAQWPLKAKRVGVGKQFAQGVSSKDLVYLIMPDRFSNGDTLNDKYYGYKDTLVSRIDPIVRHGGDLQGVIHHLDYLKELGVTALWLTPVIENDMPLKREQAGMMAGYHGYWFTNHYAVDKRLGGDLAYKKLIDAAHVKGLKIIQDAVYNHVGIEHWFYKDAPAKDWINQWSEYTNTNHRNEPIFSTIGSEADKKIMLDGWFVPHLPDVNQRNPYVANFLIQHALWTVEEFGIDGWRVDTYKYCDEAFMNSVNETLLKEYPSISIFGETTANSVLGSAYFAQNNLATPFKHNVPGVTDFPLNGAIIETLNRPMGWTDGVTKLYMTLAEDIMYKAPEKNCIFLDNHDMERFVSVIGEDLNKYKMGINLLLTLRGIPQLYYGTEIWMKNFKNPNDGMVRLDFPGGFSNDVNNKFSVSGRTEKEQEAFDHVQKMANFRKSSEAICSGKTMQWLPKEGVYVYFRYTNQESVMCVFNTSEVEKTIDLKNYVECTKQYSHATNVINGADLGNNFIVKGKESIVLSLKK